MTMKNLFLGVSSVVAGVGLLGVAAVHTYSIISMLFQSSETTPNDDAPDEAAPAAETNEPAAA